VRPNESSGARRARWAACSSLIACSLAGLGGLVLAPTPARAHYVGTALLHLVEQADAGHFRVRFIPSTAMRRSDAAPAPVYPPSCRAELEEIFCAAPGLSGSLRVDGLTPSSELIVQIDWLDGRQLTQVLTGGRSQFEIEPLAGAEPAAGALASYLRLGVKHIAEGVDHLLFVLGVVLLVGFRRSLLWAITGFTLAHSLTLAASVTGLLVLRPLPVEALIAFSLVLVANEAWRAQRRGRGSLERQAPTLTTRFPAALAFGFGLVHGLGFGGALKEMGLPEGDRVLALLGFNLGVELGQLAFVAVLLVLVKLWELVARRSAQRAPTSAPLPRVAWDGLARGAATYLVGCSGAYLFIARVAALALGLLLLGSGVSRACPEDEVVVERPIELVRQGHVWELALPHAVFHHGPLSDRPELAAALSPALRTALRHHLPTLSLMDEIGRRQGVVLVGIGDQAPLLAVPSGRSPFRRLGLLAEASGSPGLLSLAALLQIPPGVAPQAHAAALRHVLPDYPVPVVPATYGKLVGAECNIGPREKFLMLLLADGKVALLGRAGFLHYTTDTERRVTADSPTLGAAERWSIERPDAYTISLASAAGTYLRWGVREFYELDAGATSIESAPVYQRNHERFFLWANGDGTVSLKLADNRVSVSVVEWQIPRQGIDSNCHYYGYRQDPSDTPLPVSISLGSPP
jgi:hypothetical protein